jgi:hypothetical protein
VICLISLRPEQRQEVSIEVVAMRLQRALATLPAGDLVSEAADPLQDGGEAKAPRRSDHPPARGIDEHPPLGPCGKRS